MKTAVVKGVIIKCSGELVIEPRSFEVTLDEKVLKFIGGPTGFESYNVSDRFIGETSHQGICPCAGVLGRWNRMRIENWHMQRMWSDLGIDWKPIYKDWLKSRLQ